MDERLERLESKLMAAEDHIDELNRSVWRQQQELDLLRAQLQHLAQQLRAVPAGERLRAEDEIPPHW